MGSRPPAEPGDDDDDDALDLTEDMEIDPDDDPGEGDDDEDDDQAGPGEGDDEEPGDDDGPPEIGFEDDQPGAAEPDNAVIRRIRDRNRELARENAALRSRQEPPVEDQLGPKPTLGDCDFDEDKFETALLNWKAQQARIEAARTERQQQSEAVDRDWRRDLENYETKRAALGLVDFDEVVDPVKNSLNLVQQAVLIKVASDTAALAYALGRSDARLAELAKIHDPVKLAAAVARMEGGVKVTRKRKAPAPDRPARGSAKLPGSVDKQLEKLEADAERTGDRTQIVAYKKKLAAKGKK